MTVQKWLCNKLPFLTGIGRTVEDGVQQHLEGLVVIMDSQFGFIMGLYYIVSASAPKPLP